MYVKCILTYCYMMYMFFHNTLLIRVPSEVQCGNQALKSVSIYDSKLCIVLGNYGIRNGKSVDTDHTTADPDQYKTRTHRGNSVTIHSSFILCLGMKNARTSFECIKENWTVPLIQYIITTGAKIDNKDSIQSSGPCRASVYNSTYLTLGLKSASRMSLFVCTIKNLWLARISVRLHRRDRENQRDYEVTSRPFRGDTCTEWDRCGQ